MSDDKELFTMAQKLAEQMHANSIDTQVRNRIAAAISGGYDFADTMHMVYLDYGWPMSISFAQYWNMYRRFGIARNMVDIFPNVCWMDAPEVEGISERDLAYLSGPMRLWQRLKGWDKRQRVGRYAGLFMRVRDGKMPHEPLEGKLPGVNALVQIMPLYEGQLEVLTVQTDPRQDDYGLPTMYQYTSGSSGNRNEKTSNSFDIHPSRIIISAEGADDGGIYGIPALEAGYNSLMDLRKIIGAGGEGFYKNASQSIFFNLKDPDKATKATVSMLEKFNEQYDDFSRDRMRRALWAPGMEAKTLESSLVNPKEYFMNALNDVAASVPVAATILIGQQTGRLASDEDMKNLLSTCNSRREEINTEQVRSVIDWCMKYGILAKSEYEVEWSDLLALSDTEKLENAVKMAQINTSQFQSGGEIPFSAAEIREAAGHDAEIESDMMDDEPGETDNGEEDES